MSSVRIASSARICRKYRFYVLIAAIILTFQLILGYSVYKISTTEGTPISEWKGPDSPVPKDRVLLLSGERHRNPDDEFSDDEDFKISHTGEHQNVGKGLEQRTAAAAVGEKYQMGGPSLAERTTNNNTTTPSGQISKSESETTLVLRLDELNFKPDCDIKTKEAVSAINRAKTQECKQQIANFTCLAYRGEVYPKRLPRYCPSKGRRMGESIGCYKDDKAKRILTGHMSKFTDNTPQRCLDLCLQSGFYLAGLQYGVECFCGDEFPSAKIRESEDNCDTPCPGDPSLKCGGFYLMNIYHTGISKINKVQLDPELYKNVTEKSVKVLYLLTLNGRAVRQIRRLIKALYRQNVFIYIHVDARQDYLFRELLPLEVRFPNIRLSRVRFSTIWGGATLLEMMLHCMKETLAFTDWDWDFFINLSESDFPIKTHDEITSFLTANRGKNFLKSHGRDTQRFIVKQGLDKSFYECETRMWRIGERELPKGIRIDGGSDWIALSRNFCKYAVESEDELVRGLKILYRYTLLSAESFFHTVVRNSEFCDTFVDNNLHVTNWKRKVGCRCQYKHVVDWCGCSPNVYKPEDWSRIRSADSRPFYFARKFEPIINQAIIDQLETWLYGPKPLDILGASSYWQNEYHFLDSSPAVDDAFYTAYHSFARLSISLLDDLVRKCQLKSVTILEATLFNDNDAYKGTLVLFEAAIGESSKEEKVQLETQVRPRHFYQVLKTVGPAGRLKFLQVGTMCDQKEQLFRNFGQIIGPYSEPCLLHQWNEGEAFAATFVWIDPASKVAGSYEVKVEGVAVVAFHKPQFKQPLRPGIWMVKFMYKWELMAETRFLVLPLSHVDKKEVTLQRARVINNGPESGGGYIDHDFSNVEKFLGFTDLNARLAKAQLDAERNGQSLLNWIDNLASQVYTVQDTCYVSTMANSCLASALDICQEVPWSSKYPDPKSQIKNLNSMTGLLTDR